MTRSLIFLPCLLAGFLVSGCVSVKPLVTKQTMTLAEANIDGMECRHDTPPDTNIPRTICATQESWALFDKRRLRETEALLAEGRKYTNVGRYNRD